MEEKDTNVNKNEQNDSTEIKKSTDEKKSKTQDEDKKSLGDSFRDFRGEFRKIIWPNRSELTKKTLTVIITSLSFGLIIFVMDTIFSFGYTTFIDLLTKVQ